MTLLPNQKSVTRDATQQRPGHFAFRQARNAELTYGAQLRKVAKQVQDLVRGYGFAAGESFDVRDVQGLVHLLDRYADLLTPWARRVAHRMLTEVSQRDFKAWDIYTRKMSAALRREIRVAPTGHVFQQLMDQQVDLITSLPRQAAEQVHVAAQKALLTSSRYGSLTPEIEEEVRSSISEGILSAGTNVKARATLIARTEVARTAANLTEARAKFVGSTHYIWRSAEDSDVRPSTNLPRRTFNKLNTTARGSHRLLNGKVIAWDEPPIAGPQGQRAHAGCIFNCRCYSEPIISDRF